MNELTKSEQLTQAERAEIDAAEEDRNMSAINLGIVFSRIKDKQKAIAAYTNRSQSQVARLVMIGQRADKFIHTMNNPIHNLPEGWGALYQLSDLTKRQIAELCADGTPTQKNIRDYKIKLGLLDPPAMPVLVDADADAYVLGMLNYARENVGLSDFARRSLEKDRAEIVRMLNSLNKTAGKKALDLVTGILKFQAKVFNRELQRQLPERIKEAEAAIQVKVDDLKRRERQLVNGIPEKDKKAVYAVIHPDKAPAGMEKKYARAFDIVRKWQ